MVLQAMQVSLAFPQEPLRTVQAGVRCQRPRVVKKTMSYKFSRTYKRSRAVRTGQGLGVAMQMLAVLTEIGRLAEGLVANVTSVRTDSRVSESVAGKISERGEGLSTHAALERTLARVSAQVVPQVDLLLEKFPANVAIKASFGGVSGSAMSQ